MEIKNDNYSQFQEMKKQKSIKDMTNEELARYHYEKRMAAKAEGKKLVTNLKLRKVIFYPILGGLKLLYRGAFGEKIKKIENLKRAHSDYKKRPKIFVPMHIGPGDIETVYRTLNEHMILLLGDPAPFYKGPIGKALKAVGAIYMETDREKYPGDSQLAYDTSLEVLNDGGNLLLFAEGVYNFSYEDTATLVGKLYDGAIRLALESKRDPLIVPISLDKKNKTTKVIISEPIDLSKISKKEVNKPMVKELSNQLRDTLATGKYKIIESEGVFKREKQSHVKWWKRIDQLLYESKDVGSREEVLAEIERTRYKDKNITDPEEVFGVRPIGVTKPLSEFNIDNPQSTTPYSRLPSKKPLGVTLKLIKKRSK